MGRHVITPVVRLFGLDYGGELSKIYQYLVVTVNNETLKVRSIKKSDCKSDSFKLDKYDLDVKSLLAIDPSFKEYWLDYLGTLGWLLILSQTLSDAFTDFYFQKEI